ncbi:MAG TPA: alkaline phosphatase family protein [Solirubrobacterales bacterium]
MASPRNLALALAAIAAAGPLAASSAGEEKAFPAAGSLRTKTPVKHLVVIIPENQSFDHYFGTYPQAENLPGETPFEARPGTPPVDGLTPELRQDNPNLFNPYRLAPTDLLPCDPDHAMPEQERAINRGAMDMFVEESGDTCPSDEARWPMGYFDGNTVTAHWNYAQAFAMSDAFHADVLGPSTPGHLALVAGQTHGTRPAQLSVQGTPYALEGTLVDDADPRHDDCSDHDGPILEMRGRNVGDLLTGERVSWGYFHSGFTATRRVDGRAICGKQHGNAAGTFDDYIPHHEPFQYYEQTANPRHLLPSGPGMIGSSDRANHQYATAQFWKAADRGRQPAVSFLKPPAWADGHAGYSNPLSEQRWLVRTINRLQRLDTWRKSATLIAYDDSGGWYDHVQPPLRSESAVPGFDALTADGRCGEPGPGDYQGRCGLGMRMPFIAISPFARPNHVEHRTLQQSSVVRFIEDNWRLGRLGDQSFDAQAASLEGLFDWQLRTPRLFLDKRTGAPAGR